MLNGATTKLRNAQATSRTRMTRKRQAAAALLLVVGRAPRFGRASAEQPSRGASFGRSAGGQAGMAFVQRGRL